MQEAAKHSVIKALSEFMQYLYFFTVYILAVPFIGMWDLCSLTRDQTYIPCSESAVLTSGRAGKSSHNGFIL